MEVKIGIQSVAREITLESELSADEIESTVTAAVADGGLLRLVDEKGRRVLVPTDKLGYVEIGEPLERRVGFGAM
ncbi:MAG: DUF3107 domain-containing protein [Acidothermus sp.]|nr:DUF3107 domain-containing protein [Acidothermus sp.]MCL6537070.1 DUF3107 domain-containing protein [Acidothermus sp.]